ncbi:hypothetical protein EBR43_03220, partial [bacterium]|nr:hypothetical protein [bacterium]
MPEQDPLSSFLDNLTEKIRVTKEHKNIMEAVYASASGVEVVDEQKDPFANFLQKIGNTIAEKLPQKEIVPVIEEVVVEPQKENTTPQIKTDATIVLGNKIKEALQRAKTLGPIETVKKEEPIKISQIQPEPLDIENTPVEVKGEEDDNKSTRDLGEKIRAAIEKAKEKALNPEAVEDENKPEDEQITTYINELEKIKDTGTVKQQEEANTTLKELKEYIDKTVKDYSRRILELGGGGGSVAVQYANGGTMNGDLNV